VQKNTKGELQNPFNQFLKFYFVIATGRLLFYVIQTLFTSTFYSQASTGLEIKLVLDELIDFSI